MDTGRSLPFPTPDEHRGVAILFENKDFVRRMVRRDPLRRNLITYNSVYKVPP